MDGHELAAWCALALLLIALLMGHFAFAREALSALAEWSWEQLTAEPEVDADALDLYQALRRQRLLEHVARLRRILLDDSHQSATRQIGNRLAYGQLLHELAELGEVTRTSSARSEFEPDWSPAVAVAGRAVAGRGEGGGQYAPRVEVLDFGRPRRS